MEVQQFHKHKWDYCLLLDASQYDVFSEVYDEFIDGTLEKRRSGSATPEWAYQTFNDGEKGVWKHHLETHISPFIEMPWLEID